MDYKIIDIDGQNKTFNLSYQELKEKYLYFNSLNEETFFKEIPKILHLVCIISFLKEIPAYCLVADECLIHELVHCLDETCEKDTLMFNKLKKLFKIIELT